MRQSAVSFKAKGLNFEGIVAMPDDAPPGVPGVVICHPHPLHGGNMDNNVVLAVSLALIEQGFATIRFNFRGVGNSEGEHTKGEKEYEEVLGAFELKKTWNSSPRSSIATGLRKRGSRWIRRKCSATSPRERSSLTDLAPTIS